MAVKDFATTAQLAQDHPREPDAVAEKKPRRPARTLKEQLQAQHDAKEEHLKQLGGKVDRLHGEYKAAVAEADQCAAECRALTDAIKAIP